MSTLMSENKALLERLNTLERAAGRGVLPSSIATQGVSVGRQERAGLWGLGLGFARVVSGIKLVVCCPAALQHRAQNWGCMRGEE